MMVHVLAGIAWDPQIRGYLTVAVGVLVLMGSVYLLLLTNVGARLGFMLAASALFGWCTLMGLTWWAYGNIGAIGQLPHWTVKEVVYDPTGKGSGLEDADLVKAQGLDTSHLEDTAEEINDLSPEELAKFKADAEAQLDGWKVLLEANPAYGDAKATVDEYFAENGLAALDIPADSTASSKYIPSYSFETGGKVRLPANPTRLERIGKKFETTFIQLKHPARYAVIQVQRVVDQTAEPGAAPPKPVADDSQPVVSVILERDLGNARLPGAMLTIFSGIMFLVTLVMLQRRDLAAAEARGIDTGRGKKG